MVLQQTQYLTFYCCTYQWDWESPASQYQVGLGQSIHLWLMIFFLLCVNHLFYLKYYFKYVKL
jgi:hypothetical protein